MEKLVTVEIPVIGGLLNNKRVSGDLLVDVRVKGDGSVDITNSSLFILDSHGMFAGFTDEYQPSNVELQKIQIEAQKHIFNNIKSTKK